MGKGWKGEIEEIEIGCKLCDKFNGDRHDESLYISAATIHIYKTNSSLSLTHTHTHTHTHTSYKHSLTIYG